MSKSGFLKQQIQIEIVEWDKNQANQNQGKMLLW